MAEESGARGSVCPQTLGGLRWFLLVPRNPEESGSVSLKGDAGDRSENRIKHITHYVKQRQLCLVRAVWRAVRDL